MRNLETKRQRLMRAIKRLNPVAYYPLNEAEGTVARNYAPSSLGTLNGTTTGATVGQAGLVGKAYSFDGTNDAVDIASATSLQIADAITFGGLIKPLTSMADEEGIMSKGDSDGTDYNLIFNGGSDNLRVEIRVDTSTYVSRVSSYNPNANTGVWVFFLGVYDKTNLTLYINGIEDTTPLAETRSIQTSNKSLALAMHSGARWADCEMQHMIVFNRALSAGQILELAQIAGLA